MTIGNLDFYYHKTYFKEAETDSVKVLAKMNNPDLQPALDRLKKRLGFCSDYYIRGEISGQGMIFGLGEAHELYKFKEELKGGFSFDHASGMPFLSGSGLKGILKHHMREMDSYGSDKEDEIKKFFENTNFIGATLEKISENTFRIDTIAPHKGSLEKPVPVKYLVLRPGQVIHIYMKGMKYFTPNVLEKLRNVLGNGGLGAKINYDFGTVKLFPNNTYIKLK